MESVELHPAHTWDCPECGRENFCRCVTAELTPEDREEAMRAMYDLDAWEVLPEGVSGHFLTAPDDVTCAHCGETFACVAQGQE